jgi:hypothetical protein
MQYIHLCVISNFLRPNLFAICNNIFSKWWESVSFVMNAIFVCEHLVIYSTSIYVYPLKYGIFMYVQPIMNRGPIMRLYSVSPYMHPSLDSTLSYVHPVVYIHLLMFTL